MAVKDDCCSLRGEDGIGLDCVYPAGEVVAAQQIVSQLPDTKTSCVWILRDLDILRGAPYTRAAVDSHVAGLQVTIGLKAEAR